jgi:hypothetical protein
LWQEDEAMCRVKTLIRVGDQVVCMVGVGLFARIAHRWWKAAALD